MYSIYALYIIDLVVCTWYRKFATMFYAEASKRPMHLPFWEMSMEYQLDYIVIRNPISHMLYKSCLSLHYFINLQRTILSDLLSVTAVNISSSSIRANSIYMPDKFTAIYLVLLSYISIQITTAFDYYCTVWQLFVLAY